LEYEVAIDSEVCDLCGSPMVARRGRRGFFWGCTKYPDCNGTKEVF